MKNLCLLFLGILLFPVVLNAGNMFGPGPFRNGSPLITGVDGRYQATARATNVTGIFRFSYSSGSQTADIAQNSWVFFVNGEIQRGSVTANINESSLDGILDSTAVVSSTDETGATSLPLVIQGGGSTAATGNFEGKLDLKNPNGSFSGSGLLLPAIAGTNTVIVIAETAILDANGNLIGTGVADSSVDIVIPAGTIPQTVFKFSGVRTFTGPSASTTQSSTP
jgi:hypothetical protein